MIYILNFWSCSLIRLIFWFAYIILKSKEGLAFSKRVSAWPSQCLIQSCWYWMSVFDTQKDWFCSFACSDEWGWPALPTCFSFSLPLLSSAFGIHLSCLNKLNAIIGAFKLSVYISGPDRYTVKVYMPKSMEFRKQIWVFGFIFV